MFFSRFFHLHLLHENPYVSMSRCSGSFLVYPTTLAWHSSKKEEMRMHAWKMGGWAWLGMA